MKKIIFISAIFILSFYKFISVAYDDNEDIDEKYDAIVVLTGGTGRIDTAIELMKDTKADMLFISGVNKSVTLNSFKEANSLLTEDMELKLGYDAENTCGNALEIDDFVRKNNIKNIILVTSSYHIPRAMMALELHGIDKKIKIKPFRVFADKENPKNWWKSLSSISIVLTEYSKYFVTYGEKIMGQIIKLFNDNQKEEQNLASYNLNSSLNIKQRERTIT